MKIEKFLRKMFSHAKPAVLVVGSVAGNLKIERATFDARYAPVGFSQFGLREVSGQVSIQNAVGRNHQGTTVVHFRSDTNPPVYSHLLDVPGFQMNNNAGVGDRVEPESRKKLVPNIVRFDKIRVVDMSGQSLDVLTIPPSVIYKIAGIDQQGTVHYGPTGLLAYDLSLVVGRKE